MKRARWSATLIIAGFLFLVPAVIAQSTDNLPIGLQKIAEYNNSYLSDFGVKISFFIAFVAGMLGILSPCILPILPAYFSITFKEKKNITKMTLVFFLGFSLVFVAMGVVAGFIGEQTILAVQSRPVVTIAGLFLIFMALLTIIGKGFSSLVKINKRFENDIPGVFLSGGAFALGWTACLGPILAGILGLGAVMNNVFYAGILMFFYSLGNLAPLFIISVFYDKLNISKKSFMKGGKINLEFSGEKYELYLTNIIAGLLLLGIGIIMILYGGTGIFNGLDILKTKDYFYSIQDALLSWKYANIFSLIIFTVFIGGLALFFFRRKKK